MNAGDVFMKERILMTRMTYSILKEKMEEDECGWSKVRRVGGDQSDDR
jgi:hypothetical protein